MSSMSLLRALDLLLCNSSELPMSSVRLLRCWLSRVQEDHFHHYVEIFTQYISIHHHPNQRPDHHFINALRCARTYSNSGNRSRTNRALLLARGVQGQLECILFVDSRSLQVLFEANELAGRDLERRVVDLSLFYNDSVLKRLDFKEEYQIWKRSHGGRERYGWMWIDLHHDAS
jgi:hypothetical protein